MDLGLSRVKTEVRHVFAEVKKGVGNPSLSNRALGMAVRRAFPTVVRRKIGAVHYYCGLKLTSYSTDSQTSINNYSNNYNYSHKIVL